MDMYNDRVRTARFPAAAVGPKGAYTVETAGSPDGAAFSMGMTTIITDNGSTLKVTAAP